LAVAPPINIARSLSLNRSVRRNGSTPDHLIANCDEFIFYDDLVREKSARRRAAPKKTAPMAVTTAAAATSAETPPADARAIARWPGRR
jgi:hypothetical protein